MLAVKPWALDSSYKKLATIRVRSSIGHRKQTRSSVGDLEVLVLELVPIDGLASGTVKIRKITTLEHKIGNNPMENAPFVQGARIKSVHP